MHFYSKNIFHVFIYIKIIPNAFLQQRQFVVCSHRTPPQWQKCNSRSIFQVDYILFNRLIGLVSRVFANGQGDQGSIQGRLIPTTLKMLLDTLLINIQQY